MWTGTVATVTEERGGGLHSRVQLATRLMDLTHDRTIGDPTG